MKKYILLFLLLGGAVALASAQNAIKGKIKGYIGEKITVSYYKGKQRQTDTVAVDCGATTIAAFYAPWQSIGNKPRHPGCRKLESCLQGRLRG